VATQNTLRDFGRYLQAHRHAKGLSLDDVAQLTRVTPANLQHIENESLDKLPASIFVKGFLRAYAEAVGADAREAVSRYEARCRRQVLIEQSQGQHNSQRYFYLRLLLALLLFAMLVGGTLYFAQHRTMHGGQGPPAGTDAPVSDENVLGASPQDQADEITERAMAAVTDDSGIAGEAVSKAGQEKTEQTLELESSESTWLKIIIDGGAPKVFKMEPADKLTLTAKAGFSLLIGNAGGLRIMLNGKPVQNPGKSGQVITLQLP
jgi:cytoskeletal protein RodZ